jgi:hypothetical protein
MTIWRNEIAAGRLGCCPRFASQLGVRGRNRAQLALLLELLDQALLQNRAALLVGEPAAPFFLRHEPRRAQLGLEVRARRELFAHVLDGLLDGVQDLLVRHLDRGIALGLLDQQLFVHHLGQDLAPGRVAPGRILRDLRSLRLREHQLLLNLGGEDRLRAHDRHNAVHGMTQRRAPLRRRRGHGAGGQGHRE